MINLNILSQRITTSPNVQHGKPCIKGTRTPVYVILEALAQGMDFISIQKEFAPMSPEDIQACILYAALLANEEEIIVPQPV